MAKSIIFDNLTGFLEQIANDHSEKILTLENEMANLVYAPLSSSYGSTIRQTQAYQLLRECFKVAEDTFSNIAGQYGVDPWLSMLRRFPPCNYRVSGWEFYVTIGLLRYSAQNIDSTFGKYKSETQFGIGLMMTMEQVFDAFRLDSLANLMARIASVKRWIGKGAKLRPSSQNPTYYIVSEDVKESVLKYERRRQKKTILADEGFFINISKMESGFPLLLLRRCGSNARIHEPKQNILLLMHYYPIITDAQPVFKLLCAYEEPIYDIFDVSVEAISHVLYAVSLLTLTTFPSIHSANKDRIELEPHDGSREYQHRLDFLFGICQRAFLRFDRNHWIQRLSEITSPWATDQEKGKLLTEEFFNGFVTGSELSNLNLSILRPIPYVFSSSSDEIYIDLTATVDFLAWILERAKEWYSTQHGDRFTLTLKKWIESQTKARVISWKKFIGSGNEKKEADLLVHSGSSLFSIECKAFRKSRNFFRGDSSEISYRRNRIKKAVQQSKETVAVIQNALKFGNERLPAVESVEAVVCTPTQEYLIPFDEYGMLTDNIPRVCTPEELIQVLNRKF